MSEEPQRSSARARQRRQDHITIVHEIGEDAENFLLKVLQCRPTKASKEALILLKEIKDLIMANQEETLAKIAELKTQVASVGAQIVAGLSGLQAQIVALQEQIAAGADTSVINSALDDLKTSVQAVDDLVDDLPVEPAPEA
jgi:hypothetical protein